MKMKKVSKSRWTMLALVVVGLIVVFSMSGCSMLTEKMNQVKRLQAKKKVSNRVSRRHRRLRQQIRGAMV